MFGGGGGYGAQAPFVEADPSQQIIVRNLPWSTAHDDLVELFETTGSVELAEILFDGTRSKGMGIVQFTAVPEAETAIAKFSGYVYGGRPLGMQRVL
jgi:RNA recognition motif-containing protein